MPTPSNPKIYGYIGFVPYIPKWKYKSDGFIGEYNTLIIWWFYFIYGLGTSLS